MYKVSETIRTTHGQDGGLVLDIRQGQMLQLNVTGALIFKRLQEGRTESQIIDEISQEFHIRRETANVDVWEFLNSLERQGLIHGNEPGEVL
jgi:hypothetical protein